MLTYRISAAALLFSLALAGCSWDEDVVPAMTGEPTPGEAQAATAAPVAPVARLPHGGVTQFESTGTPAGEKAAALRGELAALQAEIDAAYAKAEDARSQAMAGLSQTGSPAGTDAVAAQIAIMSEAAGTFESAKSRAADLLAQTQDAYNLEGVTDEDRHQLGVLEGEIRRTASVIDQTSSELRSQIAEGNAALARARGATATAATSDMPIAGPVLPAPELAAGTRPFVVIRFDQPDVAYQSQLATAINEAMQRRPGAIFDLVAVSPSIGSAADVRRNTRAVQRSAREVLEYMTSVGVPPDHVTLSATTNGAVTGNEVQIFVR
ncbi:MAG: hypothetical protein IRY94_11665 [Rhodospirillaceae bacterium]|nr:hypothetical protein [Rhodospirillaceae bacterium]